MKQRVLYYNRMKKTERKAFNFLRSYFDVLNMIPEDSDKLEFLMAIINKQFLNEDPKGMGVIANISYEGQRHSVEKSIKGYYDAKRKPLTAPLPRPLIGVTPNPSPQEKEQEQEKEKVKEKGKTINERKAEFKNSLSKFRAKYDSNLLNDFYSYWTEHGDRDKKMRFEKQTSFAISRRLGMWNKNNVNSNFKNQNNGKTIEPKIGRQTESTIKNNLSGWERDAN